MTDPAVTTTTENPAVTTGDQAVPGGVDGPAVDPRERGVESVNDVLPLISQQIG